MTNTSTAFTRAITSHPRVFAQNRYVYPVISRRSRGLSVGVNLNPDKICNFDCIYCQVDRTVSHNGEIWAKLDAGTSDYYDLVERTKINFDTVVQNIHLTAQRWPLVIQSLFMRIRGKAPSAEEINAYYNILADVQNKGGALTGVQIYTVARRPAEPYVEPLTNGEVDAIAKAVRQVLPNVPVDVYYGAKPGE